MIARAYTVVNPYKDAGNISVKFYWGGRSRVCYCTVEILTNGSRKVSGSGRGRGQLDRYAESLYEALTACGFVMTNFADGIDADCSEALKAVAAYLEFPSPFIVQVRP